MIADLESLEKRLDQTVKKARGGEKEAKIRLAVMEPVMAALRAGKPARSAAPDAGDKEAAKEYKMLQLLTAKPVCTFATWMRIPRRRATPIPEAVAQKAAAENARAVG